MTLFFDFVKTGKIKVRIMFRNMNDRPSTPVRSDDKYFKLYYQFIKHAFGLRYIPSDDGEPVYIRIYLDKLPDKNEKSQEFKKFIYNIPQLDDFKSSNIKIRQDDVADVCSHDHVLLQCVDIVLGAMYFRLNQLHKAIPEGQKRRGKKTIAKEKLYNHIYSLICESVPHFNIGISTGKKDLDFPQWEAPYRHWVFKPY